jgi:hypothetical protein
LGDYPRAAEEEHKDCRGPENYPGNLGSKTNSSSPNKKYKWDSIATDQLPFIF